MNQAINKKQMAPAAAKKSKKPASLDKRKARSGWLFILPFLLGFVLIFAGMVCAIVGFIMAIYSLAKKKPRKGMAVAGLICSGIPVVFFIWGALTNL